MTTDSKYLLPANWSMFIIVVIRVLVREGNSVGTDVLSIIFKENKNRVPGPKDLYFLTKVRARTGDVKI